MGSDYLLIMKYLITESQDERIMKIIKDVAESFTNKFIDKTEVEVESKIDDSGETYYVLYPKFFVKEVYGMEWEEFKKTKNNFKHELADFVETMVGVPIHSYPARIQII